MALTDVERQVLAFEAEWWRFGGSKEQSIRDQFDLTATRYYQLLDQLVVRPDALAHAPVVVERLRRLAELRARGSTWDLAQGT